MKARAGEGTETGSEEFSSRRGSPNPDHNVTPVGTEERQGRGRNQGGSRGADSSGSRSASEGRKAKSAEGVEGTKGKEKPRGDVTKGNKGRYPKSDTMEEDTGTARWGAHQSRMGESEEIQDGSKGGDVKNDGMIMGEQEEDGHINFKENIIFGEKVPS